MGQDLDQDGYTQGQDCDDEDATVNPAAQELCNGVDDDCDGEADDDAEDARTWYEDGDGDGYGQDGSTIQACEQPADHAGAGGDCDDEDPAHHPGATEDDCTDPNDYNCDGSTGYADADGDGYAACTDCDDTSAGAAPDAVETCDGVDNDCDGTIDESDAADAATWYRDGDGDGYGWEADTVKSCDAPGGYVAAAGDCDDSDPAYNPGASEADCADPNDYNCDGTTEYADGDGDGAAACEDCDDGDATVNPAASELCNGLDDDCDGVSDEDDALDADTWYADADSDGYGVAEDTTAACAQPTGFATEAGDCDDTDAAYHPGATEDDCTDPNDYDCDGVTSYRDDDGDGYAACEDCDDASSDISPGAEESCDEVDNDCDGDIDESGATGELTWYADDDGDGYGDPSEPMQSCDLPESASADDGDCDDGDATVSPAGSEQCNGIDDDCDDSTDEGIVDDAVLISSDSTDVYKLEEDGTTVTVISSLSVTTIDVNSITSDLETGATYVSDGGSSKLYSLDVCTGVVTLVGKTGVGSTCGISFGPDGDLYGLDNDNDQLVEFDASGAATPIGSLGFDLDHCGLAYDCTNDRLIGMQVDSTALTGFLFTVDVSTGAATKLVDLDSSINWKGAGLEVEPGGEVIYAMKKGNTYLIDPDSGEILSTYSTQGGNNLTFWNGSCD